MESVLNSPTGSANPIDFIFTQLKGDLTSQEIRLVSTDDSPWRWSIGGIYRKETDRQIFYFNNKAGLPASLAGRSNDEYQSDSYAAFGELTRTFLDDKLKLTGGLRYFHDKVSYRELSALDTSVTVLASQGTTFSPVTSRFVVAYDASDAANLYASFSQGFRSGFAQSGTIYRLSGGTPSSVSPDKLNNYEIGSKGVLFDGRVSYELAGYYIDWKDSIQVRAVQFGPATANVPSNSPGVSGFGADATLNFRPTDRLTLGASFSWNDLTFNEDIRGVPTVAAPAGVLVYPKGSRPPETSSTTAGVNGQYVMPLGSEFEGTLAGSLNYASAMSTAAATTAAALEGDEMLVARASFQLSSPHDWSATLFVDNLTDDDPRIRPASPLNPLAGSDRLRPRTYGLQLDYRFN